MDMAINNVGSMGAHSAAGKKDAQVSPGSSRLTPLMCVNTWEHVWMYDYGVGGKRDFLNSWWDVVDWHVVHQNYSAATQERNMGSSFTTRSHAERRSSMYSS
jgi:Fe-Mn family superoxide dismutase